MIMEGKNSQVDIAETVELLKKLNEEGRDLAFEYIAYLVSTGMYRTEASPSGTVLI